MGQVFQLAPTASVGQQIRDVFDHWRARMGHDRARLDGKRIRTVRAMLAAGYSVDDLKLAVDGCAASEWHRGKNDRATVYDSLGIILKDADHVDRFMQLGDRARRRAAAATADQAKRAERAAPPEPKRPMPESARIAVRAYLSKKNGGENSQ